MIKYFEMKWNLIYLDKVTSTNDVAKNLPCQSVVVARDQTNGRGRCSRVWVSEADNLFCSVVLKSYGIKTPLLSFILGLSVVESLKGIDAKLKWPNDVLIDGKKVAGILLENEDDKIIAGVGINTNSAPKGDFLYPVGCLNGLFSNEVVLNSFLNNLELNLDIFEKEGFCKIRQKWLSYAIGVGQKISVQMPYLKLEGIFEDMTAEGAIQLKLNDMSCKYITAGDVFLLNKGK